jgi:hypothetical protein
VLQSPVKGKRGKVAKKTGSAELQLAGVLHIMKLLGTTSAPALDTNPVASPSGRRKSAENLERPLQPELVSHVVDGLFDRCCQRNLFIIIRQSLYMLSKIS